MEEKVLAAIKNHDNINIKKLIKYSGVNEKELTDILIKLKSDGKVLEVDGRFTLFPSDLELGTVSASRSGRKYIFTDNGRIPIASDFSNTVIINDKYAWYIESDITINTIGIITFKYLFFNWSNKYMDNKLKKNANRYGTEQ